MMLFLVQMTFEISLLFGNFKKLFLDEEKKTTFWMPNRKKIRFSYFTNTRIKGCFAAQMRGATAQ